MVIYRVVCRLPLAKELGDGYQGPVGPNQVGASTAERVLRSVIRNARVYVYRVQVQETLSRVHDIVYQYKYFSRHCVQKI
jgi:hypothetical protein